MTSPVTQAPKQPKERSPEVEKAYEALRAIRDRLKRIDAKRSEVTAERAKWWEFLFEQDEKDAEIARVSGVNKTFPRLDVQRRQQRARGEELTR